MNRSSLLMLKVGIMMVNILIATLFFTAVIPPITGGVSVELPEGDSLTWEVYGHNISVNTTVKIINHAYYSIDGIKIWIDMKEPGGMIILNRTVETPPIKSGSEIIEPIHLLFDMDEILQNGGEDLVFSDTELEVKVSVMALYTFKTIRFSARYADIYLWEALIRELSVDTQNTTYESSASGLVLTIPYVVETSSLLSGRNAEVELILQNGTGGEIARDYETVNLGHRESGDITFTVENTIMDELLTNSQRLNVHASINLAGERIEEDYPYEWGAPFNNLSVSEPHLSGSRVSTAFSFDNDMEQSLNIRILMEIFDSSRNQIGYGSDTFTVASGEHVSRSVEASISGTPAYARITMEELNTGFQYSTTKGVS